MDERVLYALLSNQALIMHALKCILSSTNHELKMRSVSTLGGAIEATEKIANDLVGLPDFNDDGEEISDEKDIDESV